MSSEKTVGLWPLFTIYGCIVKKFNRLGKWEKRIFSCISGSLVKIREYGRLKTGFKAFQTTLLLKRNIYRSWM
jgi:hypothetical protein